MTPTSILDIPDLPDLPLEQRSHGPGRTRYEDISQDGRVLLPALLQAAGPPVWGALFREHDGLRAARVAGVLPILSRLVIESAPGPFAPLTTFEATGGYQLAHAGRGDEVERILVLMWGELRGPRAPTPPAPPAPGSAGDLAPAGRFFMESVLTRLFAPPGERKVLQLDVPGFPAVPAHRHPVAPLEAMLALPEGAVPLEPDLRPDAAPIVFGLCHTDGNQHVNSLVYPRLFEDASLRRLASLGVRAPLLAVQTDVAFRKPFFAGERARITLRAFSLEGRFGAVGVFLDEGAMAAQAPPRPHAYVRMLFEP
jgi:hypothetical protein